MSIETMLDDLIAREGGYANNPADKGGATNYGITEQVARANGFRGDMRELPRDTAKAIYRQLYWVRPGFYDVSVSNPSLAEQLFDCGVNMGPKVAATFLQRALNVLNRGATDYPDIPADGDIGPLTLNAIGTLKKVRGHAGMDALSEALECLRGARYIDLAERNPSQETFELGWLSRLKAVSC